jgi:hypothetical protein
MFFNSKPVTAQNDDILGLSVQFFVPKCNISEHHDENESSRGVAEDLSEQAIVMQSGSFLQTMGKENDPHLVRYQPIGLHTIAYACARTRIPSRHVSLDRRAGSPR